MWVRSLILVASRVEQRDGRGSKDGCVSSEADVQALVPMARPLLSATGLITKEEDEEDEEEEEVDFLAS